MYDLSIIYGTFDFYSLLWPAVCTLVFVYHVLYWAQHAAASIHSAGFKGAHGNARATPRTVPNARAALFLLEQSSRRAGWESATVEKFPKPIVRYMKWNAQCTGTGISVPGVFFTATAL